MLVYDICNKKSFEFLQNLANNIRIGHTFIKENVQKPILMVGNKHDLEHLRLVMVFCFKKCY